MQMMQRASTGTSTMAFSERPASPTLTNPDMILPYGGEYDSIPSPPQNPFSAPNNEWRDPTDENFSLSSPSQIGSNTPTTPIIYGNGTMLSDIGEVTEAENTPGRKLPGPAERRMLKQQAQALNMPIGSSPTMGHRSTSRRAAKMGNHQRNVSVESTSTVTSLGQSAEFFKDFDDGVSVDDSVFQGDDEESVADSYRDPYREEVIDQETQRLAHKKSTIGEEEEEDLDSSARRAEQILLNAKQRLTSMEGNLNRARTSLITPARSMSSIHSSSPLSRSTPSPPTNGLANGPSKHRQLHTPIDSPVGTPGHSRVYSENSIVSPVGKGRFPVRSASAAARYIPNNQNGLERKLGISQSYESLREEAAFHSTRLSITSPLNRTSPPRPIILEPLDEDVVNTEFDRASMTSSQGGSITPGGGHTLSRSASTTQMRDLRDQMSDLKGRLSVLRDRARDDTMKRRSLQSLRTPSPFTAAEQWYTNAKGYGEEPLSADAGLSPTNGLSPTWKQEDETKESLLSPQTDSSSQGYSPQVPDFEGSDVTSVYEDVEDSHHFSAIPKRSHEPHNMDDETASIQESILSEAEIQEDIDDYNDEIISVNEADDYESDSSYHDSLDVPISHEDREDAFDYEHFFLHSAMGTIGRQARDRRGSTASFSSEDSVETTRGPVQNSTQVDEEETFNPRASLTHLRSTSNASISTMATFATAEENNSSDEDRNGNQGEDEFAVRQSDAPKLRLSTPVTTKRSTFGGTPMDLRLPEEAAASYEEPERSPAIPEKTHEHNVDERNGTGGHRPSVSSFDSCTSNGSSRSFPLVNPPKVPKQPAVNGSRGSGESKTSVLTSDSTLIDRQSAMEEERLQTSPVHMLARDDQILVERLVASLGKCVLGLQESGRGSYDSRVWRRRLDAARRVLEGDEGAI